MSEDGILLSIVNKDNDRDVICVAPDKAFQGKLNLPKSSGNSLMQLRNFSGCLIFELTKRYLESALSRLNSSCPANLRIERSAISPLVEPTTQEVDENNSTKNDDGDDDDEIDDDGDVGVEKTDPYHGLQEEQQFKVISQCDPELQLPSGNSRDGSQIMTGSEKVGSVVNADSHTVPSSEGKFSLVVSPVNKMLLATPYQFILVSSQSAQQLDSLAVQPMTNIGNNTIKACSSGYSGSNHTIPEEGSRCVTDRAAGLLPAIKGGEVEYYVAEKEGASNYAGSDHTVPEEGTRCVTDKAADLIAYIKGGEGEYYVAEKEVASNYTGSDPTLPDEGTRSVTDKAVDLLPDIKGGEVEYYVAEKEGAPDYAGSDYTIPEEGTRCIMDKAVHLLADMKGGEVEYSVAEKEGASDYAGSDHTIREEGTRCIMDKAVHLLADMKGGEDADYFAEKVFGTGIHNDMSENEEVSVHRESISGDLHDQPSWSVYFCSSDLPGQGHVILRSNKKDSLPEASSSSFGHVRANTTVSSVNPISPDSANIPSVIVGASNELVGDGLSVGENFAETETESERFSCGSVIETVSDTLRTEVPRSPAESISNSKDRHTPITIGAEKALGKDRHCRMKKSVEMNVKPSCERSVTVETGDKPEQGPTTDVFVTREGITAQILLISLSIDELLHRVRHDHFSYIKASKIKPRLSLSSEKTEWKREAWLKCYPCRIFHPTCQKLLKHIKNKHLTTCPVVCEVCKKEIKTPRAFQEHQLKHSSIKPYACRICKKRFTTPATLDGHKKSHRMTFTCVTCGLVLNNFVDMVKHRLTHRKEQNVGNDPLGCSVCGKRLATRLTFEAHMRGHRGEKPYACSICNKAFTYQLYMKKHERAHAADYKPYSCKQCKKTFLYPSDLKKHERFHTGEKPYTCQTCSKSFVLPYQLKRHVRLHTIEKPFTCDVCNKRFAFPYKLKTHVLTHTAVKSFACDVCNKCFDCAYYLKEHKLTHSGIRPFMCARCGKLFRNTRGLMNHERTCSQTSAPIVTPACKEHLCSWCGKRFSSKKGLGRHEATHSDAMPYLCNQCGEAFRLRQHLVDHQHVHCGEKIFSDQDCKKVQFSVSRGKRHCKGKGIFPSDRCEDTVSGENSQPHPSFQDAVSLPGKPWTCDTCGQTFRSKSALTRHIRKHTNSLVPVCWIHYQNIEIPLCVQNVSNYKRM